MKKGLLLGNGINACLDINDLSVSCIGKRFKKNVLVYSAVIQNLFGVKIHADFWGYIESKTEELGIERLAGIMYKYIKDNNEGIWTDNDEYRLQDVVACVCISSIFFTEQGKINQKFDKTRIPSMDDYDYIYTLNYVELWDVEHKCIHLHGRVDLTKLRNEKKVILVSDERMNLVGYSNAVKSIKKTNSVIEFSPNEIIFAPDGIPKTDLVCVTGVFPSNKLYPANDLFLYREKELYLDLDRVDDLDIFGMSPYGDDSIINKINSKKHVRVFIYKKHESDQTKEWNKKLACQYELLDSEEFM